MVNKQINMNNHKNVHTYEVSVKKRKREKPSFQEKNDLGSQSYKTYMFLQ